MTVNRILIICAAIVFGAAFILELVGLSTFRPMLVTGGLALFAAGHAV